MRIGNKVTALRQSTCQECGRILEIVGLYIGNGCGSLMLDCPVCGQKEEFRSRLYKVKSINEEFPGITITEQIQHMLDIAQETELILRTLTHYKKDSNLSVFIPKVVKIAK